MVQAANSIEMLARRNCASILLAALAKPSTVASGGGRGYLPPLERLYKCKECDRTFGTFQALGGHRASHMKITLPHHQFASGPSGAAMARPVRRKVHECDQCRERFPSGQTLGGHMRKHAQLAAKRKRADENYENSPEGLGKCDETSRGLEESAKKKKRVILQFDLNSPAPVDEASFAIILV